MPAAPSQPGAEAGGRGTGRPARQHVRNPPEGKPPRPAPAGPAPEPCRCPQAQASLGGQEVCPCSGAGSASAGTTRCVAWAPLHPQAQPPPTSGRCWDPAPSWGGMCSNAGRRPVPVPAGARALPSSRQWSQGEGKPPSAGLTQPKQILPGSEAAGERRSGRGCHAHSCGGNAGGGARRPLPPAAPPRPPPPLHARLGVGDRRIGPPTAPLLAPRPGGNRLPFHWARSPAFSVQSLRLIVPTGVPRYGVSLTPERSLVPLRRQRLPRRCPAVPA